MRNIIPHTLIAIDTMLIAIAILFLLVTFSYSSSSITCNFSSYLYLVTLTPLISPRSVCSYLYPFSFSLNTAQRIDDAFTLAVFNITVSPTLIASNVAVADTFLINFTFAVPIFKIIIFLCRAFALPVVISIQTSFAWCLR